MGQANAFQFSVFFPAHIQENADSDLSISGTPRYVLFAVYYIYLSPAS